MGRRKLKDQVKRLEPDEDERKEGITFDKLGRMQYHPDFHDQHKKPFITSDNIYLCKYYEIDGARTIGFALGKTEASIANQICLLKKVNLYEFYKNMSDEIWAKIERKRLAE